MSDSASTSTTRHMGDAEAFEDAEALRGAHYAESWLVAVGIDDYGGEHPALANARNDAVVFAQLLQDKYGFQHVITLFDAEASQDALLELLRDQLPKQVGPDDRLVIFFAGHGTTRISDSGFKRGYIIPQDASTEKYSSYIDMDEVRDACNWIPAKHILIILDCCFSGIAAVASRSTPKAGPSVINDVYLNRITQRNARQVMTAGASDEVVADSGSRPGHSAFTGALLFGLEGLADHNEDGIITASDLAGFIKPEVTRETATARSQGQTPFFNYLAGSDQGDVVFIRPDTQIRIEKLKGSRILPPLGRRSPLWVAAIVLMSIAIVVLGYLVGTREDPEKVIERFYATATADAAILNAANIATSEAAIDEPAPTQTAIAIAQIEEIQARETALAATIAVLAATPEPTVTHTFTPTHTPVPTNTSTPTNTPDLTATQAAVQATLDANATATRLVERTAEARVVALAATATTTHLIANGPISMAGATTLEGITNAILTNYRASGYSGPTPADYVGTRGGFIDYFCAENRSTDIALVTGKDREVEFVTQCNAVGREPIGFQVAMGKVDVDKANERYEPLYLYTTGEILKSKPQVAAFIRYYLTHVDDVMPQFGGFYSPASASTLEQSLRTLNEITP